MRSVPPQNCLYPEEWQSQQDWTVYNTEPSIPKRLVQTAARLHLIGLTRANEKTFAAAAAIATHKDPKNDPAATLRHTNLLKTMFHQMQHGSLMGPQVYPRFPEELAGSYDQLIAHITAASPCIPSQLPDHFAQSLKLAQPCRKTRTGCVVAGLDQTSAGVFAPSLQHETNRQTNRLIK